MAPLVYKAALLLIVLVILGTGACDLLLYLSGQQTISAWLRLNVNWFVVPLKVAVLFALGLTLHLLFNG